MTVTTQQTDLTLIGCRYVGGVVSYYYHSNDDVIRDTELQGWIHEIIVFGRLGDEQKGSTSCHKSVVLVKQSLHFKIKDDRLKANSKSFTFFVN